MTLSEILVGLLVLFLAAGLFAAITRPGAVAPTHFDDKDADGEPDVAADDPGRRAAVEADEWPRGGR
jgi:hypothetical protein